MTTLARRLHLVGTRSSGSPRTATPSRQSSLEVTWQILKLLVASALISFAIMMSLEQWSTLKYFVREAVWSPSKYQMFPTEFGFYVVAILLGIMAFCEACYELQRL